MDSDTYKVNTEILNKSSVNEIRERFDNDVDRFANLDTGQQAVIDAKIMLELITLLSVRIAPNASRILDIGCGAGNNTIRIVREKPGINCDLLDLSMPMLKKAEERLSSEHTGSVRTFQGDIRSVKLPRANYDIIIAAAVLHHLRDDDDWLSTFRKIFYLLRPCGVLLVSDMVFHADESIQNAMWQRYSLFLKQLGGSEYRDHVFEYIDREDSPRDVIYQLDLMRKVGFTKVDILHKNSCFAAYVGIK